MLKLLSRKGLIELLCVILLGLFLIPVGGVFAAFNYYVPVGIYNNSSEDLSDIFVLVSLNNAQLADMGYISSSGLDTNVQEGASDRDFMVADSRLGVSVPTILSYQNRQVNYRLGDTPGQTTFPIIVGVGGNITTPDSASSELGNNFTIEQKGWVDTDNGTDKNLIYKEGVFRTYVSPIVSGNITSTLSPSVDFTTFTEVDGNGKLTVTVPQALGTAVDRDEDVYLYKDKGVDFFDALDIGFELYINPASEAGSFGGMAISNTVGDFSGFAGTDITATAFHNAGNYNIYLFRGVGVVEDIFVASANTSYYCVLAREAGNDTVTLKIYSGSPTTLVDTLTVAGYGATKYRYVYAFVNYNAGGGNKDFYGYVRGMTGISGEGVPMEVSATGISSEVHTIATTANLTSLGIWIDGVLEGSTTLTANVTDNSANWVFLQNDVMPSMEYLTVSVNGTQRLWYGPNTMVIPANLPDRSGNGNTGTINWGENPEAIIVSVGGVRPAESYVSEAGEAGAIKDFLPDAPSIVYIPPALEDDAPELQAMPMYIAVDKWTDEAGMSTQTGYVILIWITALVMGVAGFVAVGSSWGFIGGFGFVSALGMGTPIWPLFLPLLIVIIMVLGVYAWRVH